MTSKSQLLRCWLEILSLGGPTSGGDDLARHSNFLIQWEFRHQDMLPLNSANHPGDLSENQCTPWTRAYASPLSVSLSSAPLPYSGQLTPLRDIFPKDCHKSQPSFCWGFIQSCQGLGVHLIIYFLPEGIQDDSGLCMALWSWSYLGPGWRLCCT